MWPIRLMIDAAILNGIMSAATKKDSAPAANTGNADSNNSDSNSGSNESTSEVAGAGTTQNNSGTQNSSNQSSSSTRGAAYLPSPTSDIAQIYEVLAPMAGGYMNAQAEQIGQAQRSMGTLAGRTQGATTSGLGNYTYNRLMRPQVQTMRDEILVQGYTNQLNRLLSDALNNARKNYSKATNGPQQTQGDGVTKVNSVSDNSTGNVNPTQMTSLPNSYSLEQEDGTWKTYHRTELDKDDRVWVQRVDGARKQQEAKGRGFKYGS